MNTELQLRETLRYFLLPIPSNQENHCLNVLLEEFNETELDEQSYSKFLMNKHEEWEQTDVVDSSFKSIIIKVLLSANPVYGSLFAEKYFEIHSGLSSNPFLQFNLRTILLSHLRLICSLAIEEKMSSAKIARILNATDTRLSAVSWKEIQLILRKLRFLPEVSLEQAESLYLIDEQLEEEYFADSNLKDASFQIGQVGRSLRFEYDAEDLLNRLADPLNVHLPYLQILHYQCLISGFYDNVLSIPYEFSPRGNTANWLFAKWNNLLPTSNPILNNAKAVDVLDKNWARSKRENEFEKASVLVDLLCGIDGMGFAASQEFASWIRRFLIRYIKQNTVSVVPIDNNLDNDKVLAILNYITSSPTSTFGILEQRLVDVLSAVIHSSSNWRSRGLGDSVNTNNTSRKKLGDSDFQDSSNREIVAYEAHGGRLSKVYYEGHIRTFHRAFEKRKEELESISDLSDWSIKIVFVAYDFESNLDRSFSSGGIQIQADFQSFNSLMSSVDIDSAVFKNMFSLYFIDLINNRRTPAVVREKIRNLL